MKIWSGVNNFRVIVIGRNKKYENALYKVYTYEHTYGANEKLTKYLNELADGVPLF